MYGHFVVYFTSIICLQLTQSVDVLDSKDNILCQPLPQVVSVNSNGLPYFVVLQQCQGSIQFHHPDHKKCTFKDFQEVKVKITNSGHTDKDEYVTLKNHTSCKEECTMKCSSNLFVQDESNCKCRCQHTSPPPGSECGKDHSWDSENCRCKCNLNKDNAPSNKKLDEKKCQFVCKNGCPSNRKLIPTTCRCAPLTSPVVNEQGSDNSNQGKMLAALVVGEFVFLYLIFDSILYTQGTGLMHGVINRCRRKPNDDPAQAENRPCLGNNQEENNPPPRAAVVNCNGETLITQHDSST